MCTDGGRLGVFCVVDVHDGLVDLVPIVVGFHFLLLGDFGVVWHDVLLSQKAIFVLHDVVVVAALKELPFAGWEKFLSVPHLYL